MAALTKQLPAPERNRETCVGITVTFSQFMCNQAAVVIAASEESRTNRLTHSLVSSDQPCLPSAPLLARDANPFTRGPDYHFWQTAKISSAHIQKHFAIDRGDPLGVTTTHTDPPRGGVHRLIQSRFVKPGVAIKCCTRKTGPAQCWFQPKGRDPDWVKDYTPNSCINQKGNCHRGPKKGSNNPNT